VSGHSFIRDTSLGILVVISRNSIKIFQRTMRGMANLASGGMPTLVTTAESPGRHRYRSVAFCGYITVVTWGY
jgi:hypothetical protein